jgi:hypothetical protein
LKSNLFRHGEHGDTESTEKTFLATTGTTDTTKTSFNHGEHGEKGNRFEAPGDGIADGFRRADKVRRSISPARSAARISVS